MKVSDVADIILLPISFPRSLPLILCHSVAEDKFSETTIGYRPGDLATAERFLKVFDTPTFRVGLVEDVAGVSLCGALKNVVAIAAGFTDGLGWGSNAKAAVMRIGLMEMKRFAEEFFEGVKPETFTETSAGVADLITTCECRTGRSEHDDKPLLTKQYPCFTRLSARLRRKESQMRRGICQDGQTFRCPGKGTPQWSEAAGD